MKYENFIMKQNIRIENAFEYLYRNFIPTIADFDYLVDWQTVINNKRKYELLLINLNYLLGKKDNFKDEFEYLFRENPSIVEAFPILLATREIEINMIDNLQALNVNRFVFRRPNLVNIDIINHYYYFIEQTGLKSLFCDYGICNLVDYVFGVEVGLNSNARKNRTGNSMEEIVEYFLTDFCLKNKHIKYISQATREKIYIEFGISINIDKNNRRFDFALYNTYTQQLYLLEVNYYSSQGSKLKATAGEYQYLNDFLKSQGFEFIWITDGKGWLTALNSLEETFFHNDYVINIEMLKNGILEEICK